jgi:hypothetical protein
MHVCVSCCGLLLLCFVQAEPSTHASAPTQRLVFHTSSMDEAQAAATAMEFIIRAKNVDVPPRTPSRVTRSTPEHDERSAPPVAAPSIASALSLTSALSSAVPARIVAAPSLAADAPLAAAVAFRPSPAHHATPGSQSPKASSHVSRLLQDVVDMLSTMPDGCLCASIPPVFSMRYSGRAPLKFTDPTGRSMSLQSVLSGCPDVICVPTTRAGNLRAFHKRYRKHAEAACFKS